MKAAQFLLSVLILGVLVLTLWEQEQTWVLLTQRIEREEVVMANLSRRLDAIEQDDCSQAPMEWEGEKSRL